MEYAEEKLIELGVTLTGLAVKGTASTIQKKISAAKAKKNDKETIELYDEIVNEAQQEAKIIIERAKVEINREKEKVEDKLKREAIDLAIELSKKVIEKNIDEEKNRELIGEFITKVGNS